MAKVTMPQLGESVAEGTIGRWLKKPGDSVAKYEPLLEVITDKVNAEVPSPVAGVLKEILVEEGATVPNNAEIAVIEEAGEGAAVAAAPTAAEKPTAASAADSGGAHVEPRSAEPAASASAAQAPVPAAPAAAAPAPAVPAPEAPAAPLQTAGATAQPSAPAPAAPAPAPPAPTAQPAHGPAGSDERPAPDTLRPAATASGTAAATATAPSTTGPLPGDPDARMTPAVRRLLREHALEPAQIVGTGGGGRISREDVLNYVEAIRTGQPVGGQHPGGLAGQPSAAGPASIAAPAAPPLAGAAGPGQPTLAQAGGREPGPTALTARQARPGLGVRIEFPDGADEVLVPMTQMRKGIAAQMTRSLQIPHAYVQMEIDATNLVRLREGAKRDYQAREALSLSYVPFVVKAAVEALKQLPRFNAHWTEQGLLAKRHVNVGVAVAVDDGLIVPVVRDVDKLSINGLNHAIAEVSARARANRLRVDDFGGGTFTVDNTGWLGSNMTMPIINAPEVAIVTMEEIRKRAVVVETADGDVIAIRPVMNMVLAIDHRANDGAGGAAFLKIVKDWLEAVGPDTQIY